ncbi:hypothetical protein [Teredinibacter sp. KSP-S5-2]|uniref:hypothetical protein n=1 Tax=Teredinibacter sp. KSP-S5-2 TaxID=3034506 RepID=UPI00293427F0|nr:hypothetical protein [Teredinibacter sp. KSP-S5-2]WNO10290.1 hypothetical protein P5V12_03800 [Teredinibacter sp. KSP-S5-2]
MALTHFRFHILPKGAVSDSHGSLSGKLSEYAEYHETIPPEGEFVNYWKNYSISDFEAGIRHILPRIDSWGDARVYGCENKTKVEIDEEDVLVKFDVLSPDYRLLKEIYKLSLKHECVVVLSESGSILALMNFDQLVQSLHESKAYRFLQSPNDILEEIKQKNTKH